MIKTGPPGRVRQLAEVMHDMSVEERMGPGGLDPVEVFATLPVELQECCLDDLS